MTRQELSKAFEPAEAEKRIYDYWLKNNFFHALDESEKKPFSIVIPPPNVTGMLHMGHALNNTLQDIIIRYKRMQGYNALWMPGMDHAGIATQNVVEQELAKEGLTRHDLGREKFIARVWQWKEKYGGVIINQLKRLGCSCDWQRERFTMDEGLSQAVREVFVKLFDDGLIYQGDYIVNWCPRCHTAISDLEVEFVQEASCLWHIGYPYADGQGEIIVATTRPETMLGDTAVAVHPDDKRYKDKISKFVVLPLVNKKIPIIADEYVTMDFGSGAVKITPGSDPNDFAMAQRHNLEIINIMDGRGVINEKGGTYKGQERYEARKNIVADLEKGKYLIKTEPYSHNVGKCYRCKTDIEPMVSKQWFVKIQPLAKQATKAVVEGKTKLVPKSWEATYFEWMNNIRDWCISRQLWWGHRIPVWYCNGCSEVIVSKTDPDKCPKCGAKSLKQDEDVLDTWFSSALWPFSTLGWPKKTKALQNFYPTSLLITGFDILFFWVARMMMMGLYVMKDVPFKDVYLHALVRDEKGEKMSKSSGNIIDPLVMIEKYGTDAFRFTLAAYTAQGRDVRMSPERIEGYKFFVNKIWNAAKLVMNNLNDYDAQSAAKAKEALPDKWIKSRLNLAIEAVNQNLEEYRFNEAAAAIYRFVWHEFCDWYLELIKPALYGKKTAQRAAAQKTMHDVFKTVLQLLHPFMPFVSEELWQALTQAQEGSVMISAFPQPVKARKNTKPERDMQYIMDVIASVRNIRGEMQISPAKKLKVLISVPDASCQKVINAGKNYIVNLANAEELKVDINLDEPKGVATGVINSTKVFVPVAGIVDIAGEKLRLQKELTKVEKDLQQSAKKLANRDFMEKAAAAVIKKEEEKLREFQERHAALESALNKLNEIHV
ncbi:MAG TPA: valine--tRNA ligase [Smithellaceae bacterium]|nr:valine--tRNA ligase [Smithellaceae bacterium]HRS88721.1 valine--tRNA ligase [Smithellaceae bacterium]HRV26548.1 valine--tRNA ligase [Smithellaceae bacterium]